jgi:hypothetical protein
MNQSRRMSLIEASTNVAFGFVLALVMQGFVYPLFGIRTTIGTDAALAVIFTCVSLARSYLIRRAFESCRPSAANKRPSHARSQA